jgi:hypothetical protein
MSTTPRFGLGFRTQHFAELCERPRAVDWLELLSDNFLGVGGPRRAQLERLRADFPVALHGVSLGIANDEPPASDYVAALRELAELTQPLFVSDHLCWTGLARRNSHDLLPVALTREVLELVAERVERVQDTLGRRLLLENASAYVKFRADEMSEGELFAALCARTGCGVLLDVNNLVVNAANLGADPTRMLAALRREDVAYLHVAGHAVLPDVRIDTHGAGVAREVWTLLGDVARRFPHAHVILERDDAIPPLADLTRELAQARAIWCEANAAALPVQQPAAQSPPARRGSPAALGWRLDAPSTHEPPGLAPRPGCASGWRALAQEFWRHCEDGLRGSLADPSDLLDASLPVMAARGMRVYGGALTRMPERALAANFPTLARVLSPRDFSALCAAFARAHPSTSHDYLRFGAALAQFIETFRFADDYAIGREAFADIARLEQAQLEVQEAPDVATQIGPEALAAIDPSAWPAATFELAPACRGLITEYDVLPALRAVASRESPPLARRTRTGFLITRDGGSLLTEPIEPAGALALELLRAGETFANACARAGGDDAAPSAARALALACARGGVVAIRAARPVREPTSASSG